MTITANQQPTITPKNLHRIRLNDTPSPIFPSQYLSPMQVVSSLAGDQQPTDSPTCVCPFLASIFRHWTTLISQVDADRCIKPLLPKLVGTNQGPTVAQLRSRMTTAWLTGTYIPFLMDFAGAQDSTSAFQQLPELPDASHLQNLVARARAELATLPITELHPPNYGLRMPDDVHRSGYEAMAAHTDLPNLAETIGDLPHLALGTAYFSGKTLSDIGDHLYQLTAQHVAPHGRPQVPSLRALPQSSTAPAGITPCTVALHSARQRITCTPRACALSGSALSQHQPQPAPGGTNPYHIHPIGKATTRPPGGLQPYPFQPAVI